MRDTTASMTPLRKPSLGMKTLNALCARRREGDSCQIRCIILPRAITRVSSHGAPFSAYYIRPTALSFALRTWHRHGRHELIHDAARHVEELVLRHTAEVRLLLSNQAEKERKNKTRVSRRRRVTQAGYT